MSMTFILTGRSSMLSASYYPPIELKPELDYYLGLMNFSVYNSIPNVDKSNNMLYYDDKELEIPVGSYELEDLDAYLKDHLGGKDKISLTGNNNTLLCELKSKYLIDFTKPRNIGKLLGFKPTKLEANHLHSSTIQVDILRVATILIDCNLVSSSYINNRENHIIYSFANITPVGYRIIETPNSPIYLPVREKIIDNITVTVTDQFGNLINFRGEELTVRLHLKKG